MSRKRRRQKKAGKILRSLRYAARNPYTLAYFALVLVILVALAVIYTAENASNPNGSGEIKGKFDTFWFMCVAVCAGYFDFVCQSLPGRAAAITLLILGTFLFGYIRGKVASAFVDMAEKKNKGLGRLKDMEGHFLICGWRPNFDRILESVLNSNSDITTDMIVLVNEAAEQVELLRSDERFRSLNYIAGDFTDEAVLERAGIRTASRALVIFDRSRKFSALEIDSRTVLAVLTMENLCPGIYIAAELLDAKFKKHLELAHCDEIILPQDYERSLLATASSGMGYSNVIRSLISDDADSGIIIDDIPAEFVGRRYGEFKEAEFGRRAQRGVLVGLLLNSGNFHQRRKDALREAQKNPDIHKVIDNLKKVKTLKSNEPLLAPKAEFVIPKNSKAIYVRRQKAGN